MSHLDARITSLNHVKLIHLMTTIFNSLTAYLGLAWNDITSLNSASGSEE